MRDFTIRSLLPYLEGRIRALNHQITSTRRGLKNSLKALWWRKERTAEDSVPQGDMSPAAAAGMYNYSTVESQMRYLSDLSFMVHDYSLAASTLRLLQGDFKADKAMRHFAGTQEMLALCIVMLGESSTREAEDCLLQAYQAYSQSGPGYGRFATRSMLHLAELHKGFGRYREAKSALMRAHYEESHVRAALLLEQTAACLLRCDPPLERKFAFHLVLAGLRYHQCDQRLLAERAYRQVLTVYSGRHWGLIEEHLHDVLCRYKQDKGDSLGAIHHMMALLGGCAHRSEAVQEHYMKQFCEAVAEHEKRLAMEGRDEELPLVLELPLPTVAADSAVVHADGVRYKGNPGAHLVDEEVWDRMHESLSTGGATSAMGHSASSNWLAGKSSKSMEELVANVCCTNEAVGVDIEFSNPLDITLLVDDVRLICELEPSGAAASSSSDRLASQAEGTAAEHFVVKRQQLTLRSKEQSILRLRVKPLVPGLLRVLGVDWCLNGSVLGRRLFPQRSGPRWKGDTSHHRLMFSVIPPMPRLAAMLHGLPTAVYAGEILRCFLELRNQSDVPLQGVRVAVSHPSEVLCASKEAAAGSDSVSLPDALRLEAGVPQSWMAEAEGQPPQGVADLRPLPPLPSGERPSMFCGSATRVWRLPQDFSLDDGSGAFWPLWVSPQRPGNLTFHLALYFEKTSAPLSSAASASSMRHRLCCISHTVNVLPSLKILAHVTPDPSHLQRCLLNLHIHNFPEANDHFLIRQVSCATHGMALSPLPEHGVPQEAATATAADLLLEAKVGLGHTSSLYAHIEQKDGPADVAPAAGALPVKEGVLQWFHTCSAEAQLARQAHDSPPPIPNAPQQPQECSARVVVLWEVRTAGRSLRLGSCLADLSPPPVPATAPGPQPPLRVVLKGPQLLRHDFSASPLCEVPLTLMVRNCLPHGTAVNVDCSEAAAAAATSASPAGAAGTWHLSEAAQDGAPEDAPSSAGGRQGGPAPSLPWQWCGQSQATLSPLPPGGSGQVGLSIVVMAPGQYQVGGYKLTWTQSDLMAVADSGLAGPQCTITIAAEDTAAT